MGGSQPYIKLRWPRTQTVGLALGLFVGPVQCTTTTCHRPGLYAGQLITTRLEGASVVQCFPYTGARVCVCADGGRGTLCGASHARTDALVYNNNSKARLYPAQGTALQGAIAVQGRARVPNVVGALVGSLVVGATLGLAVGLGCVVKRHDGVSLTETAS